MKAVVNSPVTVTIDNSETTSFPPYWKRSFGSGHAALSLREDWQDALARATRDYGAEGVRMHGIFDDDMNVVAAGKDGSYAYNWTNIDVMWDVQIKNGMRPLVELGFMPYILANCSSLKYPNDDLDECDPNDGWIRSGTAAPPRDYGDWYDLVYATVQHAVDRYGRDVVKTWEWEVWNELWGITDANECDLGEYTNTIYKYAARAIKAVDPGFRVGGPASACSTVLRDFIQQVTEGDEDGPIPLDFVSYHQYGNPRECGTGDITDIDGNTTPEDQKSVGYYWDPDCYASLLKYARKEIDASLQPGLKSYITEYSSSVGENQPDHDSSVAAAFFFRHVDVLAPYADVTSWWAFSDIFEEIGFAKQEFDGFYGLETTHGIAKPIKRAAELLHRYASESRFRVDVNVDVNVDVDVEGEGEGEGGSCQITKEIGCFDQHPEADHGCFNMTDMNALGLNALSVESCLQRCYEWGAADGDGLPGTFSEKAQFMALESGKSCWCSSRPLNDNSTACPQIDASERCNTPCNGNSNQTCGGDWAIEVFEIDCDDPPTPLPAEMLETFNAWATTDNDDNDKNTVNVFISTWDVRKGTGETQATIKFADNSVINSATVIKIDELHANPKSAWVAMGSPPVPDADQLEVLRTSSDVAEETIVVDDPSWITLEVLPNSAYLLKIVLNED